MNDPGRRILLGKVAGALGLRGEVKLDALLGAGGHRVVETDALDVAAVAGAAAVGNDDVVEGTLLGAAAGQSNLDHGLCVLWSPVAGMAR